MIRNETYDDKGNLLSAVVIDLDAGTLTRQEDGVTVETRPLTEDESTRYAPAPPEPVSPDDLIANVQAMTDQQKADLRAALGL
jgi:hypothetical protein